MGGMYETAWVAARAAWVEAWAVSVVHMLVEDAAYVVAPRTATGAQEPPLHSAEQSASERRGPKSSAEVAA